MKKKVKMMIIKNKRHKIDIYHIKKFNRKKVMP